MPQEPELLSKVNLLLDIIQKQTIEIESLKSSHHGLEEAINALSLKKASRPAERDDSTFLFKIKLSF